MAERIKKQSTSPSISIVGGFHDEVILAAAPTGTEEMDSTLSLDVLRWRDKT